MPIYLMLLLLLVPPALAGPSPLGVNLDHLWVTFF